MTTTERDRSIAAAQATVIPDTLAAALGQEWWDDAVMLGGWAIGARAFSETAAPRGLMARLGALEDRALELALERTGEGDAVARSAALDAVRRIRAAAALLHDAAAQAFSRAALQALEADARAVRHELKNPIGTIRNALCLLRESPDAPLLAEGPSASPDRLHAIALRGTGALEVLVRDRLTAATSVDLFLGRGSPLAELVARAVRGLGDRAAASGVVLVVGESGHEGTVRTRALGLDLVIRSALVAAVRSAALDTRVIVDLAGRDERCWIRVRPERPDTSRPGILDGARELAALAGLGLSGALDADGVCVESGTGEGSARQ